MNKVHFQKTVLFLIGTLFLLSMKAALSASLAPSSQNFYSSSQYEEAPNILLAQYEGTAPKPSPTPSLPSPSNNKTEKLDRDFKLPAVVPQKASRKIEIIKVDFLGNTLFSNTVLQEIIQPYLNRPIDAVYDLEALRVALTKHYIGHGYINSGALIKSFKDNVLTITIIEGRLTETSIKGLDGLRESYVMNQLWPDKSRPLNVTKLQKNFQILLQDPIFKKSSLGYNPLQKKEKQYWT